MSKKYSSKAQKKISHVMHEFNDHKLKGRDGNVVTNRDQAVAIAISEAREKGYKVPDESSKKSTKKKK